MFHVDYISVELGWGKDKALVRRLTNNPECVHWYLCVFIFRKSMSSLSVMIFSYIFDF